MYGYSYCYPTCSYPSYGYGGSCGGSGRGFALIVVLFILFNYRWCCFAFANCKQKQLWKEKDGFAVFSVTTYITTL